MARVSLLRAILHGDGAALLAGLPRPADLILTSPPYDGLRDYGGHPFDFPTMAAACAAALRPGGVICWIVGDQVVNGSETGNSFRQALHFKDLLGLRLHDTMIYHKLHQGTLETTRCNQVFEYIFVFSKGKPNTFNEILDVPNVHRGVLKGKYHPARETDGSHPRRAGSVAVREFGKRGNVWSVLPGFNISAETPIAHEHPAIMPIKLAQDLIRTWTNPGDLVVDPMAGSGTTGRAALTMGREFWLADAHDEYVDLMRRRLQQGTLMDVGFALPSENGAATQRSMF